MIKTAIKIFIALLIFVGLGVAGLLFYAKRYSNNSTIGVKDPVTGSQMVCNEVDVITNPGVSRATIEVYAQAVNGKIGLSSAPINLYSIIIPTKCDNKSAQAIYNAINYLKVQPGIQSAEPDYYGTLQ